MSAPEVTVGGYTVQLAPVSPLAAFALGEALPLPARSQTEIVAYFCAALACAWPTGKAWPAAKRPVVWEPGVSARRYGHEVFDDLWRARVPMSEIAAAGKVAFEFAISQLATEHEVKAAEGFSEAREDG